MTQFTSILPGRLWQVENLLSEEHVQEILATDWLSLTQSVSAKQETWKRKQVNWNDSTIQRYANYISSQLDSINRAVGTKFTNCGGHFWIDYPGFDCAMHTDGHLANSMQLYWTVPGSEYGTGFYHFKDPATLLYQFASVPNSGYLMLNHLNDDGSQPLHWHGMFNAVPEGTIRVSSYWKFS